MTVPDRWQLTETGIAWPIAGSPLPHDDHVEMSGRHVSLIVFYGIGRDRSLTLRRRIYWPTLRGRADDVRGYLRREFDGAFEPAVLIDDIEQRGVADKVAEVRFDGVLTFCHEPVGGLSLERRLFPSSGAPSVVEQWTLRNVGESALSVEVGDLLWRQSTAGCKGRYELTVDHERQTATLEPGETLETAITFAARLAADYPARPDDEASLLRRRGRIEALSAAMLLETPDPLLNRCFAFACLHTGEALFETKLGLVHSPTGNSYYGGVWANDQVEYFGPFAPFLGDDDCNLAALNAYRAFAGEMTPEYTPIPSSFEVEGDAIWRHCGDRGDAAMFLYGCSRYLLARGDRLVAAELWPAVEWCAEYCRRQTNAVGVVASDTDELEGRFPTGDANLSTSTLAYGGYRAAACVARGLGHEVDAADLDRRADALAAAIEQHFGASVEGFETYRYFQGGQVLRSWICLPLTMGLTQRAVGTLAALFSPRLWTDDGLATQAGETTFWDRATLYGLRGALQAGATERVLPFWQSFSRRRLLGEHVPYMVEAWPEGGQAHLAAESALYGRIVTEGLFGITPAGFDRFTCRPRLPQAWPAMALRGVRAFGSCFDVEVSRTERGLSLAVAGQTFELADGDAVEIVLL